MKTLYPMTNMIFESCYLFDKFIYKHKTKVLFTVRQFKDGITKVQFNMCPVCGASINTSTVMPPNGIMHICHQEFKDATIRMGKP